MSETIAARIVAVQAQLDAVHTELRALAELVNMFDADTLDADTETSVREVIDFLHAEYGLPRPHFSVPFAVAYPFAWLMEQLDRIAPWPPLVTRSVVHLLEETGADNQRAEARLGYRPRVGWRDAIRQQMMEMASRQRRPMAMHKALPPS